MIKTNSQMHLLISTFVSFVRTTRFASFPDHLVIQIKKFTFGLDWVPKKLGEQRYYDYVFCPSKKLKSQTPFPLSHTQNN